MSRILPLNQKYIKKIEQLLFLAGIILVGIGITWTMIYNYPLLSCNERHFQIRSPKEFRVWGEEIEIDSVLFTPRKEYDIYDKRPAIITVHGFTGSKEYWRSFANEFGRRGFITLSISARGHAGSSGQYGFTWENETLSALKWLRDNADTYHIDKKRIGLVGHSMGAFSVTLASIIDHQLGNHWVNTTIAIGGPQWNAKDEDQNNGAFAQIQLVEDIQSWFYPTARYDLGDSFDNILIKGRLNATEFASIPRNYLYIIGDQDEAFTLDTAREMVWNLGRESTFGVSNYKKIKEDKVYGDIDMGTARKLVIIPGLHHAPEGQNEIAIENAINWMEKSMGLKDEDEFPGALDPDTFTEQERAIGNILTVIGIILLILPLTIYLGNWIRENRIKPEKALEFERNELIKMFGIYLAIFVSISALVIPLIVFNGLQEIFVIDFMAFNILAVIMLFQALLMIPALIVLIYYEHKKYGEKLKDFGIDTSIQQNLKAISFGVMMFMIIYSALGISFQVYGYRSMFIYRIIGFFEAFGYFLIACTIYELFFRGFIQTKLSKNETDLLIIIPAWRELLFSALISGLIGGLGASVMVIMLIISLGMFTVSVFGIIPLLILLFTILGLFNGWLYRKTRNIFSVALFNALLLALLASVIVPSIYNSGMFVFISMH